MLILRIIRKILSISAVYIARDFFSNSSHKKKYVLTFDDGPHEKWTPKLLDLLHQHNVQGVFFVVGECVDFFPEIVKRIHAEGHIVCNHSYWHKDVIQIPWCAYKKNYLQNEKLLRQLLDIQHNQPLVFRPPRGWISARAMLYFLLHRIPVLMWSTDSRDSSFLPVDEIVEKMSSLGRKKEVLLFHDDSSLVLDVLEKVLPLWKEQGVSLPLLNKRAA